MLRPNKLRPYQQRLVEQITRRNTIVVIPTGGGKTLIAAECAKRCNGRTLFLVPTVQLVEQQAAAIREWTNLNVCEYSGGVAFHPSFQVLVSTPKAFQVLQSDISDLSWENFSLIVFDEVHHVLKQHPYRELALSLYRSLASPRVVGLSASLSYQVDAKSVESQVTRLCNELKIGDIAFVTTEELQMSGYHAKHALMEVSKPQLTLPPGIMPPEERSPHLMHQIFFKRVNEGICTRFAWELTTTISELEAACVSIVPTFRSPLNNPSMKTWGVYAHSMAQQSRLCAEMEYWYEALKLLVVSWEENEDSATLFLYMNRVGIPSAYESEAHWPAAAKAVRAHFFTAVTQPPTAFPRFEHLKTVLKNEVTKKNSFRGIIFVEQRVSTHILEYVISSDKHLSSILRPASIYAAKSPATASLSMSKSDVSRKIADFASGEINVLIATTVAEEGMDIPEANCVIRFDSMVHAVSMVQGRGRARQEGSSFLVLSERPDRPASKLEEVERLQNQLLKEFKPAFSIDPIAARLAQVNRESNAKSVLLKDPSLANLKIYAQKTKVVIQEFVSQINLDWQVELVYESDVRKLSSGIYVAKSKKAAINAAAVKLVQDLLLQ